jgi:hypothetical protein
MLYLVHELYFRRLKPPILPAHRLAYVAESEVLQSIFTS